MSKIVDFFREQAPNCDGITLQEMLDMNNGQLEMSHDIVQWLFPLTELSNFNVDAPILTEEDIKLWHEDEVLRINLLRTYDRFLNFFGLKREGTTVLEDNIDGPTFYYRWSRFNHNWLRLTRILKCMSLLGYKEHALGLFALLKEFADTQRFPISANTFTHWREAVA